MENYQKMLELLISVLIPLVVTSIISIITLIVNSIMQLTTEKNKFRLLKYNEIVRYYPKLKSIIVSVISIYNHLEENTFYNSKKFNLFELKTKTYDMLSEEFKVQPNQTVEFNNFYNDIMQLIKHIKELWLFMHNKNIPIYNRALIRKKNKIQYSSFHLIKSLNSNNSKKHQKNISKRSFCRFEKKLDRIYNKF